MGGARSFHRSNPANGPNPAVWDLTLIHPPGMWQSSTFRTYGGSGSNPVPLLVWTCREGVGKGGVGKLQAGHEVVGRWGGQSGSNLDQQGRRQGAAQPQSGHLLWEWSGPNFNMWGREQTGPSLDALVDGVEQPWFRRAGVGPGPSLQWPGWDWSWLPEARCHGLWGPKVEHSCSSWCLIKEHDLLKKLIWPDCFGPKNKCKPLDWHADG